MKKPEPDAPALKPVRGKYASLLKQGSNIVLLDSDLLRDFPDSPSVNRALRAFLAINAEVRSAATPARSRRRPPASESMQFDPRVGIRAKASSAR